MIRLRIFSALLALVITIAHVGVAMAGAWPREVGHGFVSLHVTQNTETLQNAPEISLFAEYGYSERLTLGAKIGYDIDAERFTKSDLFARWHFPQGKLPFQTAISLTFADLEYDKKVVSALHLGRGFDTKWGGGWLDAELKSITPLEEGDAAFGAYVMLGLKPHKRLMTMLAVDYFEDDAASYTKIIPSVAWQLREGRYLNVEWAETVDPTPSSKLSIGMWLEF